MLTVSRPLLAPNRPSHFPSTLNFSELSPLFTAFSETSQEFVRTSSLTALFSVSPIYNFVGFLTLEKIIPAFSTTSQKHPGVHPPPFPKSGNPNWNGGAAHRLHCPALPSRVIMSGASERLRGRTRTCIHRAQPGMAVPLKSGHGKPRPYGSRCKGRPEIAECHLEGGATETAGLKPGTTRGKGE